MLTDGLPWGRSHNLWGCGGWRQDRDAAVGRWSGPLGLALGALVVGCALAIGLGWRLSLDLPIRDCDGWFLDSAQGAACGAGVA
jgi:hypothetical protein